MPDKELLHPRQINQALGFDLLPVPERQWCLELEFEMVRIIGGYDITSTWEAKMGQALTPTIPTLPALGDVAQLLPGTAWQGEG
jgi:hypothetical protein